MKFIGLYNYVCMVCDSDGIEVYGSDRDQFRCKDCRIELDPEKAKAIINDGFSEAMDKRAMALHGVDVMESMMQAGLSESQVKEIINDAKIEEILEQMKSDEETK